MAPLRQEDYFYEDYEIRKPKVNSQPPKTVEKPKTVTKKNVKPKVKRRVFMGTVAFGVALAIVYRYAMINNMNMETIQLQKQLNELNNMNAQLQLNAEKSLNLSEVLPTLLTRTFISSSEDCYADLYSIVRANFR